MKRRAIFSLVCLQFLLLVTCKKLTVPNYNIISNYAMIQEDTFNYLQHPDEYSPEKVVQVYFMMKVGSAYTFVNIKDLTQDTLKSNILTTVDSVFVIGTSLTSIQDKWVTEMGFLFNEYVNTFYVDYSKCGKLAPWMSGACLAPAGLRLGSVIVDLYPLLKKENVNLVGFDDGAHVANIAASSTNYRVAQIYAIDPPENGLDYIYGGTNVQPDKFGANYVQAIYTTGAYNPTTINATTIFDINNAMIQPQCASGSNYERLLCSKLIALRLFYCGLDVDIKDDTNKEILGYWCYGKKGTFKLTYYTDKYNCL